MNAMFLKVLNLSINASWLILAVIVLRLALKKAPKWMHCALWAIVAYRLVCPVSLESTLSLLPSSEVIPQDIAVATTPMIHSGISVTDNIVNPFIERGPSFKAADGVNALQVALSVACRIWLLGMMTCLAYSILSCLLLKRKLRASLLVGNGVMACDDIKTPFILGIIRPVIYVPSRLTGRNLELALAHEKAHLRRGDHLWKPLGFLLLSIHWFNPLCLIAYCLLCRDIEAACDEKVIRNHDRSFAVDYSQALLDLSMPRKMITACPLAFGENGVKARVKLVLNYKKPSFWIVIIGIVAGVLLAVFLATDPKRDRISAAPKNEQETILLEENALNTSFSEEKEINYTTEVSDATPNDAIANGLKVPEKTTMLAKFSTEDDKAAVNLIYEFVDSVNDRDVNRYISLFDEENKKEMKRYMDATGNLEFAEIDRTILNIEKNEVPPYEKQEGRFEDAVSFRVTEIVNYGTELPKNTYEMISGETVHDYVIVLEKGNWKIYRVSVTH